MPHPTNRLNAFRLVQGQTKKLDLTVKTREGRPASLQGATLYMSIRRLPGLPVLVAKRTGQGIESTDPSSGRATITLDAADTAQLEAGTYRYDVWVEIPGEGESPPKRYPVVHFAELSVEDSMTEFA